MNYRILGNRLLVRKVEQPAKSAAGIQLPPGYQASNQILYRVVKCGPKVPEDIHEGCYVLGHDFMGTEFEFSDGLHKIVKSQDIMAIIPTPA